MSRYFLGADIGGTKTQALIADEGGRVLGMGAAGPGNPEMVGYEGLTYVLRTACDEARMAAGLELERLSGAGFGVAGYDWPFQRQPCMDAIHNMGLRAPFELVNDATLALLAGASQGWGVAVIAGTSNNCRGLTRDGREGRVTGNGAWFGEYGGAEELVMRALQAVNYAWTRRGPPTLLTQAFIEYCGAASVEDLLEGLVMRKYVLDGGAARVVVETAYAGDEMAQKAARWAGDELGDLAIGVIRQLGFERETFEVILAGSLFEAGPLVIDPLCSTVRAEAPHARFVRLEAPPALGGILLAMRQAGVHLTGIRLALNESVLPFLR